jgi:hypothetical protein
MRKALARTIAATAFAAAAGLALPLPALADASGQPNVVDEPDTSGLNNTWTFAPAGVPVFGLIQSVSEAPQKLLPS